MKSNESYFFVYRSECAPFQLLLGRLRFALKRFGLSVTQWEKTEDGIWYTVARKETKWTSPMI